MMKVRKPDNLGLLFAPVVLGRNCLLSIGALASFSLDQSDPNRLRDEAETWEVITRGLAPDQTLDVCLPKPRSEFLVYGSAYSTGPIHGLEVRIVVGELKKSLVVTGSRHYGFLGLPELPSPFSVMKIDYRHAYGGPGFAPNPTGIGIVPDETGLREIPNIQDPRYFGRPPQDHPWPSGFCAYPPDWPQRRKHLGTFDAQWLKTSWPHFPPDTAAEYFQVAPEDQRLAGFFVGDEPILIQNMHPARERIESALPGIRARVMVNRLDAGQPRFIEVETRAETLWLFPDLLRGVLLFRGTTPVMEEDLEDVLDLVAAWEPLSSAPLPLDHYRRLYLEPPPSTPEVEAEAEPPPEDSGQDSPPPSPPAEVLAGLAGMEEAMAGLDRTVEAQLAKSGLTKEAAVARYMPPRPADPSISPKDFEHLTAQVQADSAAKLKKLGLTPEEAIRKYLTPAVEPPLDPIVFLHRLTAVENSALTRLETQGMTKTQALAKLFPDGPPTLVPLTDLAGPGLAAFPGKPAGSEEPEASPARPAFPITVAEVLARHRLGTSLAGLDLSGLDFTGQDLAQVDLKGCVLEKTIFAQADLTGADLSETILTNTLFTKANMEKALLHRAEGQRASFRQARLQAANLSGADLPVSDFTQATLTGAILDQAGFQEAQFVQVQGRGLRARGTDFWKADLSGADLADSDLTEADLSATRLDSTSLARVEGEKLRLYGVQGQTTDFSQAKLAESRADQETLLSGAGFREADLARACWAGAKLQGTDFEAAILTRADFSRSKFSAASLFNVRADQANFTKTSFENCDLRGICLFRASLRQAGLLSTDLRDANLFGADLYKASFSQCQITGANLKRTIVTQEL